MTGLLRSHSLSGALGRLSPSRRRRLLSRGVPVLVAFAVAAFGAGVLAGGLGDSATERVASEFMKAWERGDYQGMHRLIDEDDRTRAPLDAFRGAYERAALTATAESLDTGEPREDDDRARVPVTVQTRIFGEVRGTMTLQVTDERIQWDRSLVFPGMRGADRLERTTKAPPRAEIRSRDGREIVGGPAEARAPNGDLAASIAGSVGPAETLEERENLRSRGFPPDAPIGKTGLERAAERYVAGTPGGRLTAGGRTLATSLPREAEPVRTTIDLRVQEAAVAALAGRFGGIAAIDPQTGEVRALAGIAFSAPQPPGSVFKVITATAGLESGAVKPSDSFPVETKTVIEGVDLENANGESCGGTFINSFAHSCNSVFAPLGVEVGPKRLVDTAERYGFNRPGGLPGAAESTLPAPGDVGGDLAVGSTAIGQGKVLATPLLFAGVAQVIASDGLRRPPVVVAGAPRPRPERVTSPEVARQIARMMVAVVRGGTGVAAQIDGVRVAGKTGTAELEDTTDQAPEEGGDPSADTNAWFTAFAPARRPRLAVGVMLVKAGSGGETAAPAARAVLQAGLSR